MKMSNTVSGMDTAIVGSSDTRMRNQPIQMNSRHSNGCLQGSAGQAAHADEPADYFSPRSDLVDCFAAEHV